MTYSNKIAKKINIEEFTGIIKDYNKNQIECTNHTFFRLNDKQRKIFTCKKLKEILIYEEPIFVGIQNNNNHAVFYNHNKKVIKIILEIQIRKINIVTFYFIEQWKPPRI